MILDKPVLKPQSDVKENIIKNYQHFLKVVNRGRKNQLQDRIPMLIQRKYIKRLSLNNVPIFVPLVKLFIRRKKKIFGKSPENSD